MPSTKGIKCSLKITGHDQPAQECGVTTEDNFASAFVVAEANQHFRINVIATEFVHKCLEIYVYIDGKYQNSSIWTDLTPDENLDETYHGKRERDEDDDQQAFERPWRFDDLVIVEEKSEDCEEETSDIGVIEVVVLRCNELPRFRKGHRRPKAIGSLSRELEDPGIEPHPRSKPYWKNWAIEQKRIIDPLHPKAVFEEDIKNRNLTHRVAAGDEEVVISTVTDADMLFLDSFEKPYCILVMYYRSRRALQLLRHIPSTESPTPSRASSPGLNLDELRTLSKVELLKEVVRYKKMAGISTKRKKTEGLERDDERKSKHSRVKKEATDVEVVDLTAD